jgi:ERCC4-type nuclease
LLSRRKKIQTLVGSIRGGAFLDQVLDVLIDPKREMGLVEEDEEEDSSEEN